MAKKMTLEELKIKSGRLSGAISEINSQLEKKQKAVADLQKAIKDEERKIRTHNLCSVGGLVYKYFGEDLSPDEFKETLDYIFSVDEVFAFIEDEKEKRRLKKTAEPESANFTERSAADEEE